MKPLLLKRMNRGVGARVRYIGKHLGIIVGGLEKRIFKWNWNNYHEDFMSTYEDKGYLVKFYDYKNEKGEDTLPIKEFSLIFLDRIEIEKPRKCPNLKKLISNLEIHEIEELRSLLNEIK